ncbi:MAG: FecR domain-containing protein [Tannerellaceae bacterium]|jgi:ferric-dicitrate binding protein FerR (iron transport regulator)|nr:FecR domain-containing protein [Tannerellaceae bacterium]
MKKNIPWDLIISHLRNETDANEEVVLNNWRTNTDNEALYLELVSLWDEIQRGSNLYNPDSEYYWKQFEARSKKKEKKEEKAFISLRNIKIAVAAASIFLIISVAASYLIGTKISQPTISTQTYAVLNGKSQMILPDGSSVWLNIGSTLTYETSFLNKRTVKLDGEALFDVKEDSKHPFIVDVNHIYVKVHGTRFNVQAYQKKAEVRVALLEGKVSVFTSNEVSEMKPGEIAFFNRENKSLTVEENDVVFESFWADKSYTFTAKPLGEISKYLERWYNIKIKLDPYIADSHVYTFTITDEPLETILQIMSRINPINYSFKENNEVIIRNVESKK